MPCTLPYVEDLLRRHVRDAVFGQTINGADARTMERMRYAVAQVLVDLLADLNRKREIDDAYSVEVEPCVGPLAERSIPRDAKPGDRIGKTGLVVSSDGNGRGVVFDPMADAADPSKVMVRVNLRLPVKVDQIVIEFEATDTAY